MAKRHPQPATAHAAVSGSYSDYRIHAVFAAKDDAQAHADAMTRVGGGSWGGDVEVEEFPFYPAGEVPDIVVIYRASADGVEGEIKTREESAPTYSHDVLALTRPKVSANFYKNGHYPDGEWHFVVSALTRDAALKALADRRAQVKAERAGIA